jgi:hypothetical protein
LGPIHPSTHISLAIPDWVAGLDCGRRGGQYPMLVLVSCREYLMLVTVSCREMDQGLEQPVHSLHELSKCSGFMSNTHRAGLNFRKNLAWYCTIVAAGWMCILYRLCLQN